MATVKHCVVRSCTNNSESHPDLIFLTVPHEALRRKQWAYVLNITLVKNKYYACCEQHFDLPNDAINWTFYKMMGLQHIMLKPDVVPYLNMDSWLSTSLISQLTDSARECKQEIVTRIGGAELILNKKFSLQQEQLPLKITADENKLMLEMICNDDNFRHATLLTKVHCTMCDIHLGASPIAQFDRFVHPVLNTLMCESCFLFYNSAELTNDEDGNENYCKWCAQSGTVMCCSDCPLLFCKICVVRNYGERVWEKLANADIWLCFKCNPSQLSKLHIMCSAVHEYTLKIIEKAMLTGDKDILEKDISICCKEASTTTNKRKHIVLDDEIDLDDIPIALRKRMKMSPDANESLSTHGATLADKKPHPPPIVPSSSPPPLVPIVSLLLHSKYTPTSQDPPPLRPLTPVITKMEANVGNTIKTNTNTENHTSDCIFLKNSVDKTQEVIGTLTRQCEYMRHAMRMPKNDAQYAELQNTIQHALYQCSSMLLETRKVVLMDQIHPSSNTSNKQVPARVLPAANKTAVTSVDGAAGKDATIILQNSEPADRTPLPSRPKVSSLLKRALLEPLGSRLRPTLNATNTNSAITTTSLKPALTNQVQSTNTVRLVSSNVNKHSITVSKVGSKTDGNILSPSIVSPSKKNMYDNHVIGVQKTADMDLLVMSDDESEGCWIKTEIDIIDEPVR